MNKNIKNIATGVLLASLVLSPLKASAQESGFEVDFGGLPFTTQNWYPGQSTATETISLTNNLGFEEDFYLGVDITSEDKSLGEVIIITVDGTEKSLVELEENPLLLGDLQNEESQSYNLSAKLKRSIGNQYQSKEIDFSFLVGLMDEDSEDGGGSGSNVAGPSVAGISTQRESDLKIIAPDNPFWVSSQSASVIWRTSTSADCKAVYDTASHEKPLNGNSHDYEFKTGKSEGVLHQFNFDDLSADTTYYYRLICIASPAKISPEHTFTTLAIDQEMPQEDSASDGQEIDLAVPTEDDGQPDQNQMREMETISQDAGDEIAKIDPGEPEEDQAGPVEEGLLSAMLDGENLPLEVTVLAALFIVVILITVFVKFIRQKLF